MRPTAAACGSSFHGLQQAPEQMLTRAGKRAFKQIVALDKAYIKKHGHRGKPPRLKLRTMITYAPAH